MMAVVMHGFIKQEALPEAPDAAVDIPMIKFVEKIV